MEDPVPASEELDANPLKHSLDSSRLLISASGKDVLKAATLNLADGEETIEFIEKFRDMRSFHGSTVDPLLPLLKMGGISSDRIVSETLNAFVEIMKRQIGSIDQESLDLLLDKCFTFLTVKQLAPIGIAVLERLRFVDGEIWHQIVQNGLDDSPYTDLPLSVKKRIWASQTEAFDFEVLAVLERLPEVSMEPPFESFVGRPDRTQAQKNDVYLKDLGRLLSGVDDDLLAQAMDKIIERATSEESIAKQTAIANLFHDYFCQLPIRSPGRPSASLASLRKAAKFLDNRDATVNIDENTLNEIRDAISDVQAAGPYGLLVCSSYSRDFLAEQLVLRLLNRRGPLGDFQDEQILAAAAAHVREDPCIQNLTFLCMCNMRSSMLLSSSFAPSNDEVDIPFQKFYPFMIGEMDADNVRLEDNYYTYNGSLPNPGLVALARDGWFERRVITSYCLLLYAHGNAVGLSRFRLVLDAACSASDPNHIREGILSSNLIMKSIEEMKLTRAG